MIAACLRWWRRLRPPMKWVYADRDRDGTVSAPCWGVTDAGVCYYIKGGNRHQIPAGSPSGVTHDWLRSMVAHGVLAESCPATDMAPGL